MPNHLDRPVDDAEDHILGPNNAPITLVEYGSYACPHCRAANDRIAEVRTELGDRLRYVFRHRPLTGSELARRAADLVETVEDKDRFWKAHVELMTRSETLTEEDLRVVAGEVGFDPGEGDWEARIPASARARVDADIRSSRASGVLYTPTFFINGRRYDGAWDESSFSDALLGSLGYRVRVAALSFATWAPSAGLLLLLATALALLLSNSPFAASFEGFWRTDFSLSLGESVLRMSLRDWVDDALLTIFFLVVGLEIKRELTIGHLATRRSAALPIAASIGGMLVPALLYLVVIPEGAWQRGWGVPMATDTAFAIAVIAMLGRRVPVELRIFLTAAAIVDDIGSIVAVAIFYSGELDFRYLAAAIFFAGLLALLNRSGVYRVAPYLIVGVALWATVKAGGVHATLAGVVLAAMIPTRPPPDYRTLAMQADSILNVESRRRGEQLRFGPSEPALRALDAIHDRLLSPADRMLRSFAPRSSYVVLPIFALANAGVRLSGDVLAGHGMLIAAIMIGLTLGKPLGFLLLSMLSVRLGIAAKTNAYSWVQLAGAGCLAGIGFTMSLFIAGQAFPAAADFAAAKIGVFAASLVSSSLGVLVLWRAVRTVGPGADDDDGADPSA
ncbi:MAG TPA: Na+/H+ antiporter NhaA [Gammaproteobacteria bacterium]|nr:Na+/H+ antiporter NhaA [Gammaproteobacteria bacterium]